mmetsp:Transcript_18305/g.39567  ORF Transcript_18305/g.39567 Transcript_18305/m.39567 type:complete len:334 (+) Transcript_18305:354-1355(+)|eukprot:CAMPEP_0172317162 /NCGR_PEP_ID=MMETSP1058-20130122/30721_1 /TAXON_ID=83371 /ORGANISM="Detonula confervacea, Strain CCMP 353" /LENGTH=333 /DNA_ID=CAMNT_0013031653 /DNA_START=290 /DNA_END=1291 /DNA_ORIENTATION=+
MVELFNRKAMAPSSRINNLHPSQHQHAAQFERQGDWLSMLRSRKQDMVAKGIKGWDLMEAMTTLTLNYKDSISQHRCQKCWLDPIKCICSRLSKLLVDNTATLDDKFSVKLLVLMHSKEYLDAGNSAKLLRMVLPNYLVEYYIFGKIGDVHRLAQEMSVDLTNTMILWPDKNALSVSQFLEQQSTICGDDMIRPSGEENNQKPLIRTVVLDGTYTQARNMHNSLRKRLLDQPLPVAVQLRPTVSSVFHRAQKNYGQAHQQQSTEVSELAQRVSTAEACGLLLTELGAPPKIQETITQAVTINNEALGHACGKNCSEKESDVGQCLLNKNLEVG